MALAHFAWHEDVDSLVVVLLHLVYLEEVLVDDRGLLQNFAEMKDLGVVYSFPHEGKQTRVVSRKEVACSYRD